MALGINPLRRIGFDPTDFLRPQTAADVLGVPSVDLSAALPPEAQPVVATMPGGAAVPDSVSAEDYPTSIPAVGATSAAPGIDFRAYERTRPVYDGRRARNLRLAALISAGVGGVATLATGRVTPLAAIAAGIAGGANQELGEQDAAYAAAGEAYRKGLVDLTEKDADLTNSALNRRSAEEIAAARETGLDARSDKQIAQQQYAVDALTGRDAANRASREAEARTARVGDRLNELAKRGGTVENMTPLVLEELDLPNTPEGLATARSIAESFRAEYDRGTALDQSAEARGWRSLALTASGQAEQARHNRRTEAISYLNATSPPNPTGNAFDDWRDLTSLRARIGAEENGISQADYNVAERLYVQRWGTPPGAQPGNFSRLFGMVPDADPLSGYDLTDPRNRQALIDAGYDPDDL